MKQDTLTIHAGRHPERFGGAVNTPVVRTSTVLSQTMADWNRQLADRAADVPGMYYGRLGTPTTRSLEEAFAEIEGGYRSYVCPSGLSACVMAILSFVKSGDHMLLPDTVYRPVRMFAGGYLTRIGVETTFYDPAIGAGIATLIQPNTVVVYTEAPGSQTMEMQDIPAIAAAAHAAGAVVLLDNTWATPLYFKAIEHGVDVSIQAATKYVVGHSDAMLGIITATQQHHGAVERCIHEFGQIASPDDIYLALRGLRTMHVRLERHWASAMKLTEFIGQQDEIETVLYPALPSDPGHALWKRDFTGASGLFSLVFKPLPEANTTAFVDRLKLFNIGASWGGYESLIVPFDPRGLRTATSWGYAGQAFRIHAGLEDMQDLVDDLAGAFEHMRQL